VSWNLFLHLFPVLEAPFCLKESKSLYSAYIAKNLKFIKPFSYVEENNLRKMWIFQENLEEANEIFGMYRKLVGKLNFNDVLVRAAVLQINKSSNIFLSAALLEESKGRGNRSQRFLIHADHQGRSLPRVVAICACP
jgi:hypothetical protein